MFGNGESGNSWISFSSPLLGDNSLALGTHPYMTVETLPVVIFVS